MRIRIRGKAKTLSERILREALWLFADILIDPDDYRKLHINLIFTEKRTARQAEMWRRDKYPHRFTILASSRSGPYQLLENLAHEMIHVQQYLTGAMQEKPAGTVWKGRVYRGDFRNDNDEYYNAPWEIDANGRAYWLYKRCRRHLNRCGYKLRG